MKYERKLFFCCSILAVLCLTVFADGKAEKKVPVSLHVGILNGPVAIPSAFMLEYLPDIGGGSVFFEKFADPTSLLPKMIKGEIDIGFLPANVAAKVYNSGNGALICVGISGNGNLSLITKDKNIKTLADLCGKKVTVAGQGATPEYLFRWLLDQNKIETGTGSDKVELDFSIPTANIAAGIISDKIQYAVVPEPFATVAMMKSAAVIRAINLQDQFAAIKGTGVTYPLTVMVVRKKFAESNADIVRAFTVAFNNSVQWTIAHPQKAGAYVQKHTLGLMAPVVANAIPYCNFIWIDTSVARPRIEQLLGIFLQFSPDSIGGKLPDTGFYFK
jgi:NitT/TauT family transport system substrate-binding protein